MAMNTSTMLTDSGGTPKTGTGAVAGAAAGLTVVPKRKSSGGRVRVQYSVSAKRS